MGEQPGLENHAEMGRVSGCPQGEEKTNDENRAHTINQGQDRRSMAFSRSSEE